MHIILTVLVRGEPAKWNIESLARRLLSCGRYWRRLQMLIQLPASALLLKAGVVQRTWEAAKLQVGILYTKHVASALLLLGPALAFKQARHGAIYLGGSLAAGGM